MSSLNRRCLTVAAAAGVSLTLSGCSVSSFLSWLPFATSTSADVAEMYAEPPAPVLKQSVDLLALADRMRAHGDLENAAMFYSSAHFADRTSSRPLIGLGDTFVALGRTEAAAEAYAQAAEVDPRNPAALHGLAGLALRQGQPLQAIPAFEAALAANPRDLRALMGLGVALDMTGNHQAAQQKYLAGLAIDDANEALRNNFGLSLAFSGDFESSAAVLEDLAERSTATATNRQNLALVYALAGRMEEAERLARMDLDESAVRQNLTFMAAMSTRPNAGAALAQVLGMGAAAAQFATAAPTASVPALPAADEPPPPRAAPVEKVVAVSLERQGDHRR